MVTRKITHVILPNILGQNY